MTKFTGRSRTIHCNSLPVVVDKVVVVVLKFPNDIPEIFLVFTVFCLTVRVFLSSLISFALS